LVRRNRSRRERAIAPSCGSSEMKAASISGSLPDLPALLRLTRMIEPRLMRFCDAVFGSSARARSAGPRR